MQAHERIRLVPVTPGTVHAVHDSHAGVTFADASDSCSGTGPVVCNLGDMADQAIETVIITVTVDADAPSVLNNNVQVDADTHDGTSGNDTASTSTASALAGSVP